VWDHLILKTTDLARCKKCGVVISCKSSSTSSIRKHLKIKHNIDLNTLDVEGPICAPTPKASNFILKFVTRESLREILAKCAVKDGES
jgi:BED zinc finger